MRVFAYFLLTFGTVLHITITSAQSQKFQVKKQDRHKRKLPNSLTFSTGNYYINNTSHEPKGPFAQYAISYKRDVSKNLSVGISYNQWNYKSVVFEPFPAFGEPNYQPKFGEVGEIGRAHV